MTRRGRVDERIVLEKILQVRSEDETTKIHMYHIYRDVFSYELGYVNMSDSNDAGVWAGRILGDGDTLNDICHIDPHEGVVNQASGYLTVWFKTPQEKLAKEVFAQYYISRKAELQKKVDTLTEKIAKLYA